MRYTDAAVRPQVAPPEFESIPLELRRLAQWVCWRFQWNGKCWTKVPYNAKVHSTVEARTTAPSTWSTFEQARAAYWKTVKGYAGIGFIFTRDDPYCGIDLDNCLHDGVLTPEARKWVEKFDSCTERSASGTGLHIICKGVVGKGIKVGDYEIYDRARYFTFSGKVGKHTVIESRQSVIAEFKLFLRPVSIKTSPSATFSNHGPSISERLEKAFASKHGSKIRSLFDGSLNGHPSQSEADLALASHLAFWSSGDTEVLDSMFRTSKLMRDKWNRDDYRNETISKALSSCAEFYSFNGNGQKTKPIHAPGIVFQGEARQSVAHSSASTATVTTTIVSHTLEEEQRCTDLANARRLVRADAGDIRFCYAFRKWLVWDGHRWLVDDCGAAQRRAKQIVRSIFTEAMNDSLSDKQRQALASWAIKSESDARIEAMLNLAQSEPGIPIKTEELDRDPLLLNFRNGTVDLKTGELRKHDPNDYITRVLDLDYDPEATCPLWDAFLRKIMGECQALIDFLRRAVGYSLTGKIIERVLFILFGEGANGKSVFVETIAALLGGYAKRTPTSSLMIKRSDGIPNDIAALRGMRLVHASESEQGRRLAESQIKDWTGGDTIAARFLHCEYFEYKPEFKIWLRTNHKPKIIGTDEAIWDRVKLIPFSVRIEKADQDKALSQKLLAELPGILAWAVRGCLEWQRDGLDIPEEVETASHQYRLEMDSFSSFVAACCVVGPQEWVTSRELRAAYKTWAEENGERHLLEGHDFEARLKGLGCEPNRKHAGRGWDGIGLEDK